MSAEVNLKQIGEQLHQRLLSDASLTVTGEIAELFLQPIINSLSGEFTGVGDPHLIDTAAEDALLYYFEHPAKFDPARSALSTYLRWLAKSRLLNSLGRQKNLQGQKKVVELSNIEAVYTVAAQGESDAESALISLDVRTQLMQQVERYITDPIDLRVAGLLLARVRETSEYAEAMGIMGRPATEQRKFVKRAKDRIRKIFERKIKSRRSPR